MTVHIDNPEIEYFFVHELKSDVKKFSDFILSNLKRHQKKDTFEIAHLDPKKNAYKLTFDDIDPVDQDANPFKNIDNVAQYSRKLRERAWR
jgi:hypothetical protein